MSKDQDIGISKTIEAARGVTRRTWLGGAAIVVGTGGACLTATSAMAKTSQAQAKYQDKPNGDKQCSKCALFAPPNACNLVDGTISPDGYCSLFAPKG